MSLDGSNSSTKQSTVEAVEVDVQGNVTTLRETLNDGDKGEGDASTIGGVQTESSGAAVEVVDEEYTEDSNLADPNRRIVIVTTAGLPWRTGTAVNPLMRALYLTRGRPKHYVTLLIPWLPNVESRKKLYGSENAFEGGMQEQEEWIRDFCRTRANCADEEANLRILFWNGIYRSALGSIFPSVDICSLIPKEEADIAILEEPEHLNWFRVPNKDADEDEKLGWAHKFRHVVGILHTNYAAYVKQYGMGASLVTAPALNGLSSLVVRAYCHRVIRLSATLPSLDALKEVTSNVHGVRSEFLDPPTSTNSNDTAALDDKIAPVYFVGKLIWAKGFDDVLELQERFRVATGDYFRMDIFGGGEDQKAIARAFFGRQQTSSVGSEESAGEPKSGKAREGDKAAAEIFGATGSLRSQVDPPDQEAAPDSSGEPSSDDDDESCGEGSIRNTPMEILTDVSGKTISTGVETADAALKILDAAIQGLFGPREKEVEKVSEEESGSRHGKKKDQSGTLYPLKLVPSRSRFKWRRNALPARFLGVQDHIVVRDLHEQTIFLNMSTTEVLCTTSAEALAMGKFVILPRHPSNEFFYQFPNCLPFDNLDDCVSKLQYALSRKPEPLQEKFVHMLSWEGANERLIVASRIAKKDAAARIESGERAADTKAAKFHVESAQRSRFVRDLFHGNAPGDLMRKLTPVALPECNNDTTI